MRRLAGAVAASALLLAGISALAGFLIVHFTGAARGATGVGWGMCIGGALTGFAFAQSGSPSRMSAEGRLGPFGHYWSSNPALPRSPFSLLLAALAVFAGGIALLVLAA